MKLVGEIEEIIFRNEENGYTVAVLSYLEERVNKYITVTGPLPEVHIGEALLLTGELKETKYGTQFAFTYAEISTPTSIGGIKKYLSSGLIKGVGPATAELIVSSFGSSALEIIEFSPEKLAKIRGISKKKAFIINESYNQVKNMQNSIMFLQRYEITTNTAIKIFNFYGNNTITIVKSNPYQLVEDIRGIGFNSADKIAQNMGLATDSEFRIRAGILHTLDDSTDKVGNTFLYKDILLKETAKLLGLDLEDYQEKFETALELLINDKTLITFKNETGAQVIMSTALFFTESSVAQKLALLNITAKEHSFDIEDEIKQFQQINHICFDPQQKSAITSSINNGVSVITGGPGTGKTTIIKCILNILQNRGLKVTLLAPTGRASKRLSESTGQEAKTIHRGLGVNIRGEKIFFTYNETNPLETDTVIVDEISMVDVPLMCNLLKALRRDCKLIMVGDKDQLPSVGAGNVLGDILKSKLISISYLTKIFRQNEKSLIVSNAHSINDGIMPVIDNSSNDFFFEAKENPEEIKNTIVELVTKRIPKFSKIEPIKIQVLAPLKTGASGIDQLNIDLQKNINPNITNKNELIVGKTIFREGDKVMQTVNNYDLVWTKDNNDITEEGQGVFNGDIGYISKITPETKETTVMFEDGRICVYPRTDLDELSLAYAITIHKSQGSEFDIVVIPIIAGPSLILTRNLIYTAVTRAKKMVVLIGSKKNLAKMVANSYTVQRFTMLKEFLINSNEKLKLIYQ